MTGKIPPIPDGYETVSPSLIVKGGVEALEFYQKAFGATVFFRLDMPDGRLGHAEFRIGKSRFMLADEFPEYGIKSPESYGGTGVTMHLYVEDVDAVTAKAVAAGAKMVRPASNEFYGDRVGKFVDPFGHMWMIATHVEEVSHEEMKRRCDALYGGEKK
jgi:PhnB protein